MGQRWSRDSDDGEELTSGVRITKELLDQLDGKVVPVQAPPRPSASLAVRPPAEDVRAVEREAKHDQQLAHALERSRRVGRLLLKTEEAELGSITRLADELLASEYNAPSRPQPCKEAAAAATACYEAKTADPLACAPAVEAYVRCSQKVWEGRQAPVPAAA
ncbi:COX23 [Auxenochlorella protothecoides x Auxenochlorella symbiontica]|uniref:Coiled-coil-helix-coiled-coil-helix domain-containing protein 3, mitochondrial n=1 Tax=Auxenochlorella protothecoides TaxID=3075 RepID=A0A1D2A9R5_AUXPR